MYINTHTYAAGSNYEILTCRIQQQQQRTQCKQKTETKVNSDKVTDALNSYSHTHTPQKKGTAGRLKRIRQIQHCNQIHVYS